MVNYYKYGYSFKEIMDSMSERSYHFRTIKNPKWEYIKIGKSIGIGETRIYYIASDENIAFDFFAIEQKSGPDGISFEESYVDVIYWGNVMFDGVRNLFMGYHVNYECNKLEVTGYEYYPKLKRHISDATGYENYPNFKRHIAIFEGLNEISKKFDIIIENNFVDF